MLEIVAAVYFTHHQTFFTHQNKDQFPGKASKEMYLFVRKDLGVLFHQSVEEHPRGNEEVNSINGRPERTIASWISLIYESLRSGKMHHNVMAYVE
jgi:phenylalanine ammonia-lyase